MNEKPIMFKKEMYEKISLSQKSQTRRVITGVLPDSEMCPLRLFVDAASPSGYSLCSEKDGDTLLKCPYPVGTKLWVKEKFRIIAERVIAGCVWVDVEYRDGTILERRLTAKEYAKYEKWKKKHAWKSPLFMFKSMARLWREVTAVRVERLQGISVMDAMAEGIRLPLGKYPVTDIAHEYIEEFRDLWDSINGKRYPWSGNPWVWVYTFKGSNDE